MSDAPARDAIRSGYDRRYPRAQKYVGWPMLVVLALEA